MASHLIVVLAASGLVAAGAPAVTPTRSADAMPVGGAALVQAAPSRAMGSTCFLPMAKGKIASLTDFSKAKKSGKCTEAQLQTADQQARANSEASAHHYAPGTQFFVYAVAGVAVGETVGFIVCNNGNAQTKC